MSSSSNGASGVSTPPSSSAANAAAHRSQPKITSMASKSLADTQRKHSSSPMDQTQRKQSVPNAWTKGSTNPVTQRPVGAVTANGVTNSSNKASPAQKGLPNSSKDSITAARNANDRLGFLAQNFKGYHATLTQRDGTKYTGIFSSINQDQPDAQYVLKMVKKINLDDGQVNGASEASEAYVGNAPNFTKSFVAKDVVDLQVHEVRFDQAQRRPGQNGSSRFKTDTDISGGTSARERQLQRWDAGADGSGELGADLEASTSGPWDQFKANEKLFGVKTNYDESYYTTNIDRSHPQFKEREAEAERLAQEISSSTAMNAHVAEERGLKVPDEDDGEDEESKYSGVRRNYAPLPSGQPNKYTPPARRAASGQPTVTGAPADPAIISSALAKPEKADGVPPKEKSETKKPIPSPLSKSPKIDETAAKSQTSTTPAKSGVEKVLPTQAKISPASKEGGATATVEKDVVNAFKAFTANEKLRAQEHQRQVAKRDKAVKLNDLKKFAQNFKLHTPVPQDLVPILAKDKQKQSQIVEVALKNAADFTTTAVTKSPETAAATQAAETKTTKPVPVRNQSNTSVTAPDRQNQRNRQSPSNFPPATRNNGVQQVPTMPRTAAPSQFTQNLRQQYPRNPGVPPMGNIQDPRIPPTGPAMSSGVTSPGGRLQYTSKVLEFKPNPSAHIFQPGPQTSSGSSPVHEPRRPQMGNFFANRRAILSSEERLSVKDNFNVVVRLLKNAKAEGKDKETAAALNGGFIRSWTSPTWDVAEANQEKSYLSVFERPIAPSVSPQHNVMTNPPMPHQHQLPMHLQSGGTPVPPGHTPHHTPRHAPVQPHMGPNGPQHYDDHRMQYSHSSSSVHPSPRAMQPYIAPHGQVQQAVPMYQQTMPGYGMSPGGYPMTMRQVSGGPQFMPPTGPAMGAHMMTNQPSSGPYMNPMNAQVPMYSSVSNQAYPHHNGPMPQGGAQGYPSPRPPATMMVPQGSQQGHHPQMIYAMPGQHAPGGYPQPPAGPMAPMRGPYGAPPQPHYGTSPHQVHHFPQQPHRGTPSATYVQPMMQAHTMQPQPLPPNAGPPMAVDASEDGK